ncbi:RDD family protein [Eggerthia catenaformis]|uniref:RDD family protein n=1 Tax=Eggerthia catenaformis TaxID=31973 RepID=UPI003C6F4D6B
MGIIKKLRSSEPNKKTFIRRAIAYGIDWYIGSVLSSVPLIIIYMIIHPDAKIIPNRLSIFPYPLNIIVGIVCIFTAFIYYVLIPYKLKGQTIGKKITSLRIVNSDYSDVTLGKLIFRQFIMIMVIEGSIYATTSSMNQIISILTTPSVGNIVKMTGLVITVISILILLLTPSRQSLHDIICHTLVVNITIDTYHNALIQLDKKNKKQASMR